MQKVSCASHIPLTASKQTHKPVHTQGHISQRRPKQARHELTSLSLVKMLLYLTQTEQTHLQQIESNRLRAYQDRLDTSPGAQG